MMSRTRGCLGVTCIEEVGILNWPLHQPGKSENLGFFISFMSSLLLKVTLGV